MALTSPLSAISFIILTYASRGFASRCNGLTDSLFDPFTGLCIIPVGAAACFCSWNSVWQSKGSPMQSSSTGANFDLSWLDPMPLIIKLTSVLKSPKIPSKLEILKDKLSLTCLPHDASTNSWLNVICEVKTKEILQFFSVIEGHTAQIHIFLGPFIFIFFPWSSSLMNRRTLHIKHTLVVICTKNGSRLPLSFYWGWIRQGIIQPKFGTKSIEFVLKSSN